MGDRFYSQQLGKNGYSKTSVYGHKSMADKPKRRLKADIVKHIVDMLGVGGIPSMDKMTIAGLEIIETKIKELKKCST